MKLWGGRVSGGNAPFLFAPDEGTGFFVPLGWRELRYLAQMDEARRLKREMRGMWMYRIIGAAFGVFASRKSKEAWKRFSGCVLFERT